MLLTRRLDVVLTTMTSRLKLLTDDALTACLALHRSSLTAGTSTVRPSGRRPLRLRHAALSLRRSWAELATPATESERHAAWLAYHWDIGEERPTYRTQHAGTTQQGPVRRLSWAQLSVTDRRSMNVSSPTGRRGRQPDQRPSHRDIALANTTHYDQLVAMATTTSTASSAIDATPRVVTWCGLVVSLTRTIQSLSAWLHLHYKHTHQLYC